MNPDDSAFDDIALRAFLRFGSAIGVLEEPELYPNLLDVVFELIPARRTAIMFASDDGDKFVSGIYRERGREVDADFVPSGKATRGVLATGTPSMSNDDSPPALCALMRTRTRKLGVIYAEIPLVETGFAPKHLNYMVGIAGLASAALRQAKSFEGGRTEGQLPAAFAQSGFAAGMNAHGLLGDSPAMLRLHDQVRRAGRNNRYVLILGEPGTGKELVARGIHQGSPRSDKIFLPINCASIPADTMESQMFGHEKGSFTGAISRRIGWVEIARRGTLFLDEIGDMPLVLQPKLLRFLQEQEFMRLGGNEVLRSEVRIVAATHRDLQSMVKAGLFREDLLNRLEVFTINVPPLRDRRKMPTCARFPSRKWIPKSNACSARPPGPGTSAGWKTRSFTRWAMEIRNPVRFRLTICRNGCGPLSNRRLKKRSRRNGSSGRSIKRNRTVPKPPASSA